MHDRQPTPGQEGRMLITPENGAPAFFARVQMADNPLDEGTPLNTATLLKQQTAAMFGLSDEAVPDDVYAWLGKYNQHWWAKKAYTPPSFTISDTEETPGFSASSGLTIHYSKDIVVNHDGSVSLAEPITTKRTTNGPNSVSFVNTIKGYYFQLGYSQFEGVYYRTNTDAYYGGVDNHICYLPHKAVYGIAGKIGELIDYEISNVADSFPIDGVFNSEWYVYLGIPFDNVVSAPKIEIGSYVGTGTTSHPVATAFRPKFVWVWSAYAAIPFAASHDVVGAIAVSSYPAIHYENNVALEITDTGFTAYDKRNLGNNFDIMLNTAGNIYTYLALG